MNYDEPTGECRKSAESATKPRLELLPSAALEQIAEVLTYGAAKYEANNWCRGARGGRYFAALLRHVFAWWRGEDLDPETGMSHLAHAACCLLLPILILLWATESTEQRAKRLRSYGWTQRRIAERMGISRSRVQRIVTA